VFRIRISRNADPDPGFHRIADPDTDSGFRILDPDPMVFFALKKNVVRKFLVFLALFRYFYFYY